jgi:hypothetical protein
VLYWFLTFGFPPLADPPLSPTLFTWMSCVLGPDEACCIGEWTPCRRQDADNDGDVDLRDFAAISASMAE